MKNILQYSITVILLNVNFPFNGLYEGNKVRNGDGSFYMHKH